MEQILLKGLNVVLLGKARVGISASGNTILGRQAFTSKKSSRSVTQDVAVESGSVGEIPVTVYDTPGLFNTDMNEEKIQKMINEKVLQKCESGPCVFLLVIKADSFTDEERETVEKIEKLLGEERLEKTWILFTRGDELEEENTTINEFINETEALKKCIQKYYQRYIVFNNKAKKPSEQVKMLFIKVLKPYLDTWKEEDVPEILKPNPLMRKIPENGEPDAPVRKQDVPEILKPNAPVRKIQENVKPATPVSSLSSRRIVLLGKSGVGKSAAGNTILGQREFISVQRMNSVTRTCSDVHTTVSGRSVSVVDTPGLFDTEMNLEELMTEIARSVYLSSPGPHAFLIVFPVNMRFTEHEQQIADQVEILFGQEVLKYSIILFTHGDLLEDQTVEELIKQNSKLRDLVQQCGGRYHVFNNKDQNNREQVNDLLQKIDSMIEQNGGAHYSNQMFKDALRFRQEEEERKKQQLEKKVQEEFEKVRKETEERIRAEMEAKADKKSEEEIKRLMKDVEERIREEEKSKLERETNSQSGFLNFISKYKSHFQMAAFVVGGIVVGALVLTGVGAAAGAGVGAAVTAVGSGGATVSGSVAGASLSCSVGAATGAAATGAVATGAYVGAAIGAGIGALAGGAAGAAAGVAASKDAS